MTVPSVPDGRSSLFRFVPKPKDALLVANSQTGAVGIGVLAFMIISFTIIYGGGSVMAGRETEGLVIFLIGGSSVALIILVWIRMMARRV